MIDAHGPLVNMVLAAKEAYFQALGKYPTGIRLSCASFDKLRNDLPRWANNVRNGRVDKSCNDIAFLKEFLDNVGGKIYVCGMEVELTDLPP